MEPEGELLTAPVIGRGARGAVSELRACAALMEEGYYVFRCEAPNAPFDLVAYRDGKCVRVEVKTISIVKNRANSVVFGWPTNDEWDLLVLVGPSRVMQFAAPATYEQVRDAVRVAHGLEPYAPKKSGSSPCALPDCSRTDFARGLCNTHYVYWRRAVRQAKKEGKTAPPLPGSKEAFLSASSSSKEGRADER